MVLGHSFLIQDSGCLETKEGEAGHNALPTFDL